MGYVETMCAEKGQVCWLGLQQYMCMHDAAGFRDTLVSPNRQQMKITVESSWKFQKYVFTGLQQVVDNLNHFPTLPLGYLRSLMDQTVDKQCNSSGGQR